MRLWIDGYSSGGIVISIIKYDDTDGAKAWDFVANAWANLTVSGGYVANQIVRCTPHGKSYYGRQSYFVDVPGLAIESGVAAVFYWCDATGLPSQIIEVRQVAYVATSLFS